MKPTFHHRLVNSPFEDPSLFVRMARERRAFLFDAGDLNKLGPADILKITDLFITHTHIDHFIGFDLILRVCLRRETPLRVYGPTNIIECVEGKLHGYTWNLIDEYPIKIEAFAVHGKSIKHAGFYAENCFERIEGEERPFGGIAFAEKPYTVKAAILSHGIPSLAFSLEEDYHINIDKAALQDLDLPVGPWLSELKKMIRQDVGGDTRLRVSDREFALSQLKHIADMTEGQKVSYVTDVSPERENIAKIIELVKDSDTLYCEAYFLHEDLERATERHHLTARMAGEIARKAGVKNLVPIHFSPKYRENPEAIEREAMEAFGGQRREHPGKPR